MAKVTETSIIRSSIWAAYGDAIGFPTELVSAAEFKKRNGIDAVSKPIAWRRRVGGMFGPDVEFPAGTYSDDTQLRLSTSRAINSAGFFDVESFAKIELPVWLNYALGAGRGSKAAASNLTLRESTWSLNFYSSANAKYWEGGGNGAAMRIQPHVWQNHGGPQHAFISDVIRNSVCTHGHPRALLGAIIHAAMLYETMQSGEPVRPSDWSGLGEAVGQIGLDVLEADPELPLVWIPSWERNAGRNLRESWRLAIDEWIKASGTAAGICETTSADPAALYMATLSELNAFDPSERGSGLKTPLYSSVLAWLFRNQEPETALAVAANAFGSDTDTIATMAGALIGVIAESVPSGILQDEDYLCREAARMFRIGQQEPAQSFEYPDLQAWSPPKNQSDAWVSSSKGDRLMGIGPMLPFGPTYKSKKGAELLWQWSELEFGQTVLVKRRAAQSPTDERQIGLTQNSSSGQRGNPLPKPPSEVRQRQKPPLSSEAQLPLSGELEFHTANVDPFARRDLDALTQQCIKSGFDAYLVGDALLSLMDGPDAIERSIAFAAIIAKAKVVRSAK